MKFSVIVPCYNAAPWVGAALQSVAAQTLPAHEIICIDDGSTDQTCAAIEASGVKARLLQTPHLNAAAARNAGIAAATGDWIAFQDADDLWYPEHLARAAGLLQKSGDDAYLSPHDYLLPDGRRWKTPNPLPLPHPASGLTHAQYFEYFCATKMFSLRGCAIRREAIGASGGFDATQTRRHDIEMWLRAIHGRKWCYDPVATTAAQLARPGSISSQQASCEYFLLRALALNAARYEGQAMHACLAAQARRALSAACTDGDAETRRLAWSLALPLARPAARMLFGAFGCCPDLLGAMIRFRRRLLGLPPPEFLPPELAALLRSQPALERA